MSNLEKLRYCSLITAILICIIVVNGIMPFRVSGVSMEDTLSDGSIVFVNKMCRNPSYGDIVVVKKKLNDNDVFLIKRVIGKAGDCVEFRHGHLFLNGKRVVENYVSSECNDDGLWVVPKGMLFLLGDNRADSLDSRYDEIGFINKKDVIGTVAF